MKLAWEEAYNRGKTWRQLLAEAVGQLPPKSRDLLIKVIEKSRAMITGLDLTFNNPPAHYDGKRDIVTFTGEALNKPVPVAISREALDDHFGADGLGPDDRVRKFLENRSTIERMARAKFLFWPVEDVGEIFIKTTDVPTLLKQAITEAAQKSSSPPAIDRAPSERNAKTDAALRDGIDTLTR